MTCKGCDVYIEYQQDGYCDDCYGYITRVEEPMTWWQTAMCLVAGPIVALAVGFGVFLVFTMG